MEQAISKSNSFGGSADCPRPGEQGVGVDWNAVGHLFQVGNDLEVQTASMRGRVLLESFH
jgi:hypothetical protein